ncbi:hypothetical protein KD050_18600 [Psychrobacillus sp. INOP01]|uniref:hypothetical protein n=1 Tax=Psychrobacillus sp. INOP01 TaxID=2829187 RepID=UPI001BA49DF6|nr:hypothetical protein [Psychrobacillus sp. INOP01]QUG41262.1 hypothetical protein KD050_18600 [Psychrobacillus sp. INOP01]
MKKIYIIYLSGLMIIFSYIYTKSIYEIHGLNNIGDSSLNEYQVEYNSGEDLLKVYKGLVEENAEFQLVKNPMSDDGNTYYDIYHTDINSVKQFVGISHNVYRYFKMTEDEFIDSPGYFSTNLSTNQIEELSQKTAVDFKVLSKNEISYGEIFNNNLIQFLILGITTFAILYIYTIFRFKTNAVRKVTGFSPAKIVITNIKETLHIQGILIALLVVGHSLFYLITDKFSWTYAIFLFLFLSIISIIIILLLLLLQHFVRKTNVVAALKNKIFSNRLYTIINLIKIILILSVTILMNLVINYYDEVDKVYKKYEHYKMLNSFYSSHGRNSDELDKLLNNPEMLEKVADNVKQMYVENIDKAYVMFDPVRDNFLIQTMNGISREEVMNTYQRNNIILNKNYIENYTDIKVNWDFNENIPTILVPEKYRNSEEEIKEYFIEKYNNTLNYNTRYDIKGKEVSINDIQIIYINNGYKYKILSSIPYEDEIDIELTDSIIRLDNGSFGSGFYFDMLGSSQLAFKLNDREEFKIMLIQYDLDNLYMANNLLTPFESIFSSYEFLMDQAKLFVFLFIILLVFIIYISNYIDMIVNGRRYASRYVQGYHLLKNLRANFVLIIFMIGISIVLYILKVNIFIYLLFILYDLVSMLYLYKKLIVKDIYKVLNGGN